MIGPLPVRRRSATPSGSPSATRTTACSRAPRRPDPAPVAGQQPHVLRQHPPFSAAPGGTPRWASSSPAKPPDPRRDRRPRDAFGLFARLPPIAGSGSARDWVNSHERSLDPHLPGTVLGHDAAPGDLPIVESGMNRREVARKPCVVGFEAVGPRKRNSGQSRYRLGLLFTRHCHFRRRERGGRLTRNAA